MSNHFATLPLSTGEVVDFHCYRTRKGTALSILVDNNNKCTLPVLIGNDLVFYHEIISDVINKEITPDNKKTSKKFPPK